MLQSYFSNLVRGEIVDDLRSRSSEEYAVLILEGILINEIRFRWTDQIIVVPSNATPDQIKALKNLCDGQKCVRV